MKTFLILVLAFVIVTAMLAGLCVMSACTKDDKAAPTDTPVDPTSNAEATDEASDPTVDVEEPTDEIVDVDGPTDEPTPNPTPITMDDEGEDA